MAEPAKTPIEAETDTGLDACALAALRMEATSRLEVLRRAAERIGEPKLVEAAVEALLAREAEGSTALGEGKAIPHATVEGLAAPLMVDVSLERPVDWAAPGALEPSGAELVERCTVILVPPGRHREHLALCARAARRLSDS